MTLEVFANDPALPSNVTGGRDLIRFKNIARPQGSWGKTPMKGEELERLALAYSRRFQSILREAREQIAATGGIPHDDFWREVGGEGEERQG